MRKGCPRVFQKEFSRYSPGSAFLGETLGGDTPPTPLLRYFLHKRGTNWGMELKTSLLSKASIPHLVVKKIWSGQVRSRSYDVISVTTSDRFFWKFDIFVSFVWHKSILNILELNIISERGPMWPHKHPWRSLLKSDVTVTSQYGDLTSFANNSR